MAGSVPGSRAGCGKTEPSRSTVRIGLQHPVRECGAPGVAARSMRSGALVFRKCLRSVVGAVRRLDCRSDDDPATRRQPGRRQREAPGGTEVYMVTWPTSFGGMSVCWKSSRSGRRPSTRPVPATRGGPSSPSTQCSPGPASANQGDFGQLRPDWLAGAAGYSKPRCIQAPARAGMYDGSSGSTLDLTSVMEASATSDVSSTGRSVLPPTLRSGAVRSAGEAS